MEFEKEYQVGVCNMKNTNAVVCIGELLIDFFCKDIEVELIEGAHFLKQAGGAPANVSAWAPTYFSYPNGNIP
jgi:hypothetical protein